MIIRDSRGNELLEIIAGDEEEAQERYAPITHCLAVVAVGGDRLMGWNNWRKDWEIFGGCMEPGETMRECIKRECLEEIGISDARIDYIGLMRLYMAPNYFSPEHREEFGGLYGIRMEKGDLQRIERHRTDREEIGKVALLSEIGSDGKIAEIDRALLEYYGG